MAPRSVAIKRALEPEIKAAAKERRGARTDKHPGKLPQGSGGKAESARLVTLSKLIAGLDHGNIDGHGPNRGSKRNSVAQ
jgi:hypothetical protein